MHSIRALVFSRLILVLAVFFGLVGGLAFFLTRTILAQFFLEDHARAVGFVTRNIRSNFQADLAALDGLARMDGLTPFDSPKGARLLEQFLSFENVFGSVQVYRADGKLLLDHRRDSIRPYRAEENFRRKRDRGFIETANLVLATGKSATTQTLRRTRGDLYQAYLVPLVRPAKAGRTPEVIGLLSGAIFYGEGKLDYLVKGLRLERDNFVLLTDTRGNILAHDGVGDPNHPRLLAPEIQQATEHLFDGGASAGRAPLYTVTLPLAKGSRYTVFAGAIEDLKLTLTMGASWETVRYKEALLLKWLFAAMAGGLVLCFLASMLIAEQLAKPFGVLTAAAKALDEGDFSTRIAYDEQNELGYLCAVMNRLTRKVDKGRLLGHLWLAEPD